MNMTSQSAPQTTPKRKSILPEGLLRHPAWTIVTLTGLALCLGLLALLLSVTAYQKLPGKEIFFSYFSHPLLLFLNLLPGVLFIWLFYFLFRRPWAAYLWAAIPVVAVALVNYFKISLRSDPLLAVDLRLAAEAKGILSNYTLDFTWVIWLTLLSLVVGFLFARFLIPKGELAWKPRVVGAVACLALMAASMAGLYLNPKLYAKTVNNDHINQWSDVEVFVSKGVVYPFLYSFRDMVPTPPPGYHEKEAAQLLHTYQDADIPADKKVSVMGIMLEAFCDLTDFPLLAQQEGVQQVYAPWHAFEAQSVSGDLLTNIFAGGTVNSEWGFLTGYTAHDDFRRNTDSYVWYLKSQGYQTVGSHPGHSWFYNRSNVNPYLGFDEYWFTENHYGRLVDPTSAIWNSDHVLVQELLEQLEKRLENGPVFSFSVSYQNHGPYSEEPVNGPEHLTPAATGLTQNTCNIWNNYLKGVADTIDAMLSLRDALEEQEEPVVLVLFGDHKPWGGNGNSAYSDLGADFDLGTTQGFYDYYSTPYIIWANSAAKEVLGNDFVEDGGDFSPAFLMTKVFDLAGWEGPGFMQLGRQVRDITPLVHVRDLYWHDGGLTAQLPEEEQAFVDDFIRAQYYRENHGYEEWAAAQP